MHRHWSQFVTNMSADIRGHEALDHHQQTNTGECSVSQKSAASMELKTKVLYHGGEFF